MLFPWKKVPFAGIILLLPLSIALALRVFTAGAQSGEAPGGVSDIPAVVLVPYATGFLRPVDIASTGVVGDERIFIVEKDGIIRIIDGSGSTLPVPFLDIGGRVRSTESERGLLGLVFHPDYESNGYFYVNYTNNGGNTHVSRFSVTADENIADPDSEVLVFAVQQPYENHNAGDLAFGPDGYLYIPLGDGGSGGDPQDRAQTMTDPLGKILRIDVDSGLGGAPECAQLGSGAYTIPGSNPYAGQAGVCDEIWAAGLRNPWRISFDRLTGDLYIGDVGQGLWEEVDFQDAGSNGGENYGWRCYEASHVFNPTGCTGPGTYDFPIFEYDHATGQAITGGFVYRGNDHPELSGVYFVADFSSGKLWALWSDGSDWYDKYQGNYPGAGFSSFGENVAGEIFLSEYNSGTIYSLLSLPHRAFIPISPGE